MYRILKSKGCPILVAFSLLLFANIALAEDSDGDGVPNNQDVCPCTPENINVDDHGRPIGDLNGDCAVDLEDFAIMSANMTGMVQCEGSCTDNSDCMDSEYCHRSQGHCDSIGSCQPRPIVCPAVVIPVCGCDGLTYTNACVAGSAGVSIAHDGPCGSDCTENEDCPHILYCAKDPGVCMGPGHCTLPPFGCIETVIAPVCSCDGITFQNECFARQARRNIAHDGPCETDECHNNSDCEQGHYCLKQIGQCERGGVCAPILGGDFCATPGDPNGGGGGTIAVVVCGCDGVTYNSPCAAAAAGVSIAHLGPCEQVCGGFIGLPCDRGEYCEFPFGHCNFADDLGTCINIPEVCPEIFQPVCGCDGITYSNHCEAQRAQVSVEHPGSCDSEGCTNSEECAPFQFCKKDFGVCDGVGHCEPRPICPLDPMIPPFPFEPVCGCDGQTYPSECFANQAGTSVAHFGPCDAQYCVTNDSCPDDHYCARPIGSCGGPNGIVGTCQPRPHFCPDVVAPVCGCNGQTYGNACEAAQAGVNVQHDGPCGQTCGGLFPETCPDNQFCLHPDGTCPALSIPGVCTDVPLVCPLIFWPVCGCDGNTYGNRCDAYMAGVSIDHEGTCEQETCQSSEQCTSTEYCAKEQGECGSVGHCEPRPLECPFTPGGGGSPNDPGTGGIVCGCDGQNYPNACWAHLAGTNVAHPGFCQDPTHCTSNSNCEADQYCALPPGTCGAPNGNLGTCQLRPQFCPAVEQPVCGCNGVTYDNACEAAAAGVNVFHEGACNGGNTCSIIAGAVMCPGGMYCKAPDGTCSVTGMCTATPFLCPLIQDPVCGCDGQTYDNECFAAAANVSIAHDGPCADFCGGFIGLPCPDGEFCNFPNGSCGVADQPGVCLPAPQGCPDNWNPVCGCDGTTYSNECDAHAAGVSIAHSGTCDNACENNDDCIVGWFCQKPIGQCMGHGICQPVGNGICPDVAAPVCGCNGGTYGNACEAVSAGVSIAHEGPCLTTTCGPLGCPQGQFCQFPPGTGCGMGGVAPNCVQIPNSCNQNNEPVCGCNGQTYLNGCFARAAQQSVAHAGPCN